MQNILESKIILASGSARRKEILESHGLRPIIMPMDVDEALPLGIEPQDAVMYLALKKGLAAEETLKKGSVANEPLEHESAAEKDMKKESAAEETLINDGTAPALIISADTIVYAKDVTTGEWTIMGKPKDEQDAWRMLKSITSEPHKVMTGVALISCFDSDSHPDQNDSNSYPDQNDSDARCATTSSECDKANRQVNVRRVFYDSTNVYVNPMTDDEIKAYIDSGEPFGKAGGYAIQMKFGQYIDHIEGDYENVVGFPYNHMIKELESYDV